MVYFVYAVLVLAGVLGGVANYLMAGESPPENAHCVGCRTLWTSLVLSVVASLMVPLFLNTISSQLIASIATPFDKNQLVLFGFGLVASIFSRQFISTMYNRLLEATKKTAKETKEIRSLVQPIVDKQTEPTERQSGAILTMQSAQIPLLSAEDKVFTEMVTGKWVFRSVDGLARKLALSRPEVASAVRSLSMKGYVASTPVKGEKKWYVTANGRMYHHARISPPSGEQGSV